jgi:uncharacterized protein (DUF983 family)
LQKELGVVVAETERVLSGKAPPPAASTSVSQPAPAPQPMAANAALSCPHCGAEFAEAMKFCGACGKEMSGKEMA